MKVHALALLAALSAACSGVEPPRPGRVEGRIRHEGPERDRRVRITRDLAVCAPEGALVPEGSLVTDPEGGLAGVIVTLAGPPALPASPDGRERLLTNVGCLFEPRVQVARVGDRLAVESRDPVLHSTRVRLEGRTLFNLTLPEPGARLVKPLDEPGWLEVGCDAHAWMKAWILVVPAGPAAVTDASGRFVLEGVEPGRRELDLWHERLGRRAVTVEVPPGGSVRLDRPF